jgi:hypothetical protein
MIKGAINFEVVIPEWREGSEVWRGRRKGGFFVAVLVGMTRGSEL